MGWRDGRVSGTCIFGSFIKKPIKLQKILSEYIFRMREDQNKLYFLNLMNSTKSQIQKKKNVIKSINCLTTPVIRCSNVAPLTDASDG